MATFSIPADIQELSNVLKSHGLEQRHHHLAEAVGIVPAAGGEVYLLLLVVVTALVFALVSLHLHAGYALFVAYRDSDEISDPVTVLDKSALPV